jgi:hypothetical protein
MRNRAVYQAVAERGAVDTAVYADSPHPALKLYLRGWRDE